jgi:hypothetical protein
MVMHLCNVVVNSHGKLTKGTYWKRERLIGGQGPMIMLEAPIER